MSLLWNTVSDGVRDGLRSWYVVIVLSLHQPSHKVAVLIPVWQLGKLRHRKAVSPPEAISGALIGKLMADFGR